MEAAWLGGRALASQSQGPGFASGRPPRSRISCEGVLACGHEPVGVKVWSERIWPPCTVIKQYDEHVAYFHLDLGPILTLEKSRKYIQPKFN